MTGVGSTRPHPRPLRGRPATDIDHVVLIADGGSDALENLRPACARCNRSKR
jgi:5-methylcytosine-specific restriction endonuclease McrA